LGLITLSRQAGSLGDEIASALVSKLGWQLITREEILRQFLEPVAPPANYSLLKESSKFYHQNTKDGIPYLTHAKNCLEELMNRQSLVILGFGSQILFADHPESLHIRIIAPFEIRTERIRHQYHVSSEEASQLLITSDRKQKRFITHVYDQDVTDNTLYDAVLNTFELSVANCVEAIAAIWREQNRDREHNRELALFERESPVQIQLNDQSDFKHPAEQEFARILDMYQIQWRYEPKTFPIEWDAEGNVTLAFSPDFYLPNFNTYLELTTMNQKYVTMKNKKARRLKELYPGVNVKIVYKKDFLSLVERFRQMGGSSS
jgi:cytidylate kinase